MGLMEKTLTVKKQFSGRNLHMMKAMLAYIEEGHVQENDEIELIMNVGAYKRILEMGLYKEIKRGSGERRSTDR